MTIAPPPRPPSRDELDALIKEARARQWRRRAAVAAVVAGVAAMVVVSYSVIGGHARKNAGGPQPPQSRATAAAAQCARGRPRLLLSRSSGPPGTVVSVTGCGCTHPQGQADRLAWLNSREMLKNPNIPPGQLWRRIPLIRTTRTIAKATFVVRASDSAGRGLLDMWCGPASVGNAIGYFTVTG